jgi:hypothetical protein
LPRVGSVLFFVFIIGLAIDREKSRVVWPSRLAPFTAENRAPLDIRCVSVLDPPHDGFLYAKVRNAT